MSWLWRILPSRAALWAALAALAAGVLTWSRRDARRDLKSDLKTEDIDHANDIRRRVDRTRSDPERLRPYEDRGYRD